MDEVIIQNAKSARDFILNKPFTVKKIRTPFWPALDKKLCIRAMSAQDVAEFQKLIGNVGAIGKAIQESLYLRAPGTSDDDKIEECEHGERVFETADRDAIAAQVEAGILEPLLQEILALNGMKLNAVEDAKKN